MLKHIFAGKFNYLLHNKKNSVIRKLMLNRTFDWFFGMYNNGLIDSTLFNDLKSYHDQLLGIDKYYMMDKINIYSGSYIKVQFLIQYVWQKFFDIDDSVIKLCANKYHTSSNINFFCYVLGIDINLPELKHVSDIIDDLDMKLIYKILLLENISLEFNVCNDVVNIIKNFYSGLCINQFFCCYNTWKKN